MDIGDLLTDEIKGKIGYQEKTSGCGTCVYGIVKTHGQFIDQEQLVCTVARIHDFEVSEAGICGCFVMKSNQEAAQ